MKYGIKKDQLHYFQETCTACAGSMVLELAALSRLSGIPIFEVKLVNIIISNTLNLRKKKQLIIK